MADRIAIAVFDANSKTSPLGGCEKGILAHTNDELPLHGQRAVDSALFVILAFLGLLPTEVIVGLFFSNILVKFAVTFVSIPGIYLVKEQPKEWIE